MPKGERLAVCQPEFLEDLQYWVQTDRRTAKRLEQGLGQGLGQRMGWEFRGGHGAIGRDPGNPPEVR